MGTELKVFGFSTGEVSPSIKYRSDIDKYIGSCRKVRNFDVDVSGALVRRKGAVEQCGKAFRRSTDGEPTAFFYSGVFVGREVFFLFADFYFNDTLDVWMYVRGADDTGFTKIGTVSGAESGVFSRDTVRMLQYNDVLFVCGAGIPPFQVRVNGFADTLYPETVSITEPLEARYSNKVKTATLVDSATGTYEWTYWKARERGVLNYDSMPAATQSYALAPVSMLGKDVDISTYPQTVYVYSSLDSAGTWQFSEDLILDIALYGPKETKTVSSASDLSWAQDALCVRFVFPSFVKVKTAGVCWLNDTDPYRYVNFEFNTSSADMPDLSLYSQVSFPVEVWTSNSVAGDYTLSTTVAVQLKDTSASNMWELITVRGPLSVIPPTVEVSEFPFSIPPILGFVPLDGGKITVSGGKTMTFPALATATYDSKIPFSDLKTTDVIALEQTSGDEYVVDWGEFDKDGKPETKDGVTAKTAGATSAVYYASGNTTLYFFSSGGRWSGQLALQVSYDPPNVSDANCTWIDVGYITAAADGTLSPAVTFKVKHYNARVRVYLKSRYGAKHFYYEESTSKTQGESYAADMGCKWTLRITGERRYYFKKDLTSTDRWEVGITRLNASPANFSCARYSIGAFGKERGYPLTMDIAQQRLWFFSTASYPKYFWASKVDDISNFSTGTEKDDGLCFEADSGTPDFARWLKYGKGQFQFGCTQSEGNLVGRDNQYSLNPTSLALENESAWGSANADAVLLGDKIFYIKAGRQIVHAQVYDSGRARYVSSEVNVLARHLFTWGKGAVKLAALRAPETVLFVLREDGSLGRFVFNDEQNVGAWSTYDFAASLGKITDIGVLRGDASDRLVLMFLRRSGLYGYDYSFATLDPQSAVYKDFGTTAYESELLTHALAIDGQNSYGGRSVISKLDVYGSSSASGAFSVSFDGGRSYAAQYEGISGDWGYFSPESDCRRISWSGGYSQEAVVGIKTQCDCDFKLLALGAHIVRSDNRFLGDINKTEK